MLASFAALLAQSGHSDRTSALLPGHDAGTARLRKLYARPRQLSSYEFKNLPRMASNGEFLPRSAACVAIQMDSGCLELHGNHGGLAVGIQHRRGVSGAGGDCAKQIASAMDR